MSTRLKRPAVWRSLLVTLLLLAFQGYLGFNVIGGQFGIQSQKQMRSDIEDLKAQSATLAAEIDSYNHRASLFNPSSLDPDILTEKARALLQMAAPDDLIVMTDPHTGLPISGSAAGLTGNQSAPTIAAGID
ncbi:MAG TPA: septum formation initiator family protein [Devosia sp.]|nr:septum formation initiator family protein [Devosia sp.]